MRESSAARIDGSDLWTPGIPGFSFGDLYKPAGLARLSRRFDEELAAADAALFARFDAYRKAGGQGLAAPAESELLIAVARHVSSFVGRLFRVDQELAALGRRLTGELSLFEMKREFIARRVFKKGAPNRPSPDDFPALDNEVQPLLSAAAARDARVSVGAGDPELALALVIETLLDAARAPEPFRALCQAMARGQALWIVG